MKLKKSLRLLLLLACVNFSYVQAQEPETLPVPTAEELKIEQAFFK